MEQTIVEEEQETKLEGGDPPTQWPPVAHIIPKSEQPAREGSIALCGARLMGIDLGHLFSGRQTCGRCVEEMKRRLGL